MILGLRSVFWGSIVALVLIAASDQPRWRIEGRAASSSRVVIKDATVTADGPESIVATTDTEGRYVLKGKVPGRYLISITKDGWSAPKPKSVSILPGGLFSPLDFEMNKPAVVAGRVRDDAGNPVQGAFVAACIKMYRDGRLTSSLKGRSTTNDLGEYRISGLGEGRHYLFILPREVEPKKKAIHQPKTKRDALALLGFYPNADSIESAAPLLLHNGDELEGIDIVARAEGAVCLTGSIRPPPGWSGTEAFASLYARIGDDFPTAANGPVKLGEAFEMCGVTPGLYTFAATVWDPKGPRLAGLFRTDVQVGKRDIDLGVIALAASRALPGLLKIDGADEHDSLPPRVHVELVRRGRPILVGENLSAEVLPSGEFAIIGAFADDYGLRVEGLPRGYYMREATQAGSDVKLVPVRPGAGLLSISLGSDGGSIGGQTVDKDKNPIADATVIVVPRDSDGSRVWSHQSDQNGKFDFSSGIAPGEYQVAAFCGLYEGEDRDPEFLRTNLSSAVKVTIAPKGFSHVTLPVQNVR
jgi:hypothetical protein